ncbi:hypothetical protein ACFRAR_11155 [Kitasatospora sp. NPDC056651]|uniref:hypothetical protein n=1 Tax=Kitasatospora sp. NPDC056651 TaxID=3345892 RepID=UPI0036A8E680
MFEGQGPGKALASGELDDTVITGAYSVAAQATRLGLRSLDHAATVIHPTWRPDPIENEEATGA